MARRGREYVAGLPETYQLIHPPWFSDPIPPWVSAQLSEEILEKIHEAQIAQVEAQVKTQQERTKQAMMIIKMIKENI